MKKQKWLSGLLAVLMILCSGCMNNDANVKRVAQEEMSKKETKSALEKIEASALAAAVSTDMDLAGIQNNVLYIGDMDSDKENELLYGDVYNYLLFETDTKNAHRILFEEAEGFYVDKNNTLYSASVVFEPLDVDNYGNYTGWSSSTRYSRVNASDFTVAYTVNCDEDYINNTVTNEYYLGFREQEITKEEFEKIGLTRYEEKAQKFTSNSFDIKYEDHLVDELKDYLEDEYSSVSSGRSDIDGDGDKETVFVIRDFLEPWIADFHHIEGYEYEEIFEDQAFNLSSGRTVFLVVDPQKDKLSVSAYASLKNFSGKASSISLSKYSLCFDGNHIYIPRKIENIGKLKDKEKEDLFSALEDLYCGNGFSNVFFKTVDISDREGTEVLCIGQRDSEWLLSVLSLNSDSPRLIDRRLLSSDAWFLVDYQGKTSLLSYYQRLSKDSFLDRYSYSYYIYRYNSDDSYQTLAEDSISYTSNERDAAVVSSFFTAFNIYLKQKTIVVYDPYLLLGKQWMTEKNITHGDRPEPTASSDGNSGKQEDKEYKLGFVQVEPDSWLNLRQGPGTEYDLVLTDPSNPESYVKQVLGAPVTILEEIETGDAENPVWLKVRINYGEYELVGYSSKTYIRVAE